MASKMTIMSDKVECPLLPFPPFALSGAVEGLASAAKGGLEGIVNGVEGMVSRDAEEIAPNATSEAIQGETAWGRAGTLDRHFADHGADFGSQSAQEYAQQGSDFFRQSQANGLPTKIDAQGVIRVYDPESNTFGSFNANGTTRTFFKPDPAQHGYPTNLDYWNHQPGVSPWQP